MLISQENLIQFIKGLVVKKEIDQDKKKEKQSIEVVAQNLDITNSWTDFINQANYYTKPKLQDFNLELIDEPEKEKIDLGNELLNTALKKSAMNVAKNTGESYNYVVNNILQLLKQDNVSNASCLSTIKFLRSIRPEEFLICPICGFDNESEWINCEDCNYYRDYIDDVEL